MVVVFLVGGEKQSTTSKESDSSSNRKEEGFHRCHFSNFIFPATLVSGEKQVLSPDKNRSGAVYSQNLLDKETHGATPGPTTFDLGLQNLFESMPNLSRLQCDEAQSRVKRFVPWHTAKSGECDGHKAL